MCPLIGVHVWLCVYLFSLGLFSLPVCCVDLFSICPLLFLSMCECVTPFLPPLSSTPFAWSSGGVWFLGLSPALDELVLVDLLVWVLGPLSPWCAPHCCWVGGDTFFAGLSSPGSRSPVLSLFLGDPGEGVSFLCSDVGSILLDCQLASSKCLSLLHIPFSPTWFLCGFFTLIRLI